MIEKRIIYLMLVTIALATLMAVYGLLGKGKAAPAIYMVMHGSASNYQTEENFTGEKFWDNYPYWVLLSRDKNIHANFQFKSDNGMAVTFADILKSGDSLFFRYQRQGLNDSGLNIVLELIAPPNLGVSIIVDKWSIRHLMNFDGYSKLKKHIYTTELMLPLRIEHSDLSYFFRIDEHLTAKDLFVPREAIPEVTFKYLKFMTRKKSK